MPIIADITNREEKAKEKGDDGGNKSGKPLTEKDDDVDEEDLSWLSKRAKENTNSHQHVAHTRKEIHEVIDDEDLSSRAKRAMDAERKRQLRLESRAGKNEKDPFRLGSFKGSDVLIPEYIGRKLKPHQMEGVHFMWDNCFESIEASTRKKASGLGCILAHAMGLGKTLQCVSLIQTVLRHKVIDRVLVICPVNVVFNWDAEFHKWIEKKDLPNLFQLSDAPKGCRSVKGKKAWRGTSIARWRQEGGILIAGYEVFRGLMLKSNNDIIKMLVNGPELIIVDEGHRIKNPKSQLTKAVHKIRNKRRVVLTGTPLQNNLLEYYCMVDFVRPGYLGRVDEFRNRFQTPILNGQCADSSPYDVKLMRERAFVLHDSLKGFVNRKDYSHISEYLPAKEEHAIMIRLSDVQTKLYKSYLIMLKSSGDTRKSLFKAYHALSKIWNYPDVLVMNEGNESAKVEEGRGNSGSSNFKFAKEGDKTEVVDLVGEDDGRKAHTNVVDLLDNRAESKGQNSEVKPWYSPFVTKLERNKLGNSGKFCVALKLIHYVIFEKKERMLIFSTSLLVLDLLQKHLDELFQMKLGREIMRLDGSKSAASRQKDIERFNDESNKEVWIYLISTRAGGIGVNLLRANHVILMDVSWNPSHDLQAIFRSYRFGQKRKVYVYRLVSSGTMEQKIYERQILKQGMALRVVDEAQVQRHFTSDMLADLFKFAGDGEESTKNDDDFTRLMQDLSNMKVSANDSCNIYNPYTKNVDSVDPESPMWSLIRYFWKEGGNFRTSAKISDAIETDNSDTESELEDSETESEEDDISSDDVMKSHGIEPRNWLAGFHKPAVLLGHVAEQVLTKDEQKEALKNFKKMCELEEKKSRMTDVRRVDSRAEVLKEMSVNEVANSSTKTLGLGHFAQDVKAGKLGGVHFCG